MNKWEHRTRTCKIALFYLSHFHSLTLFTGLFLVLQWTSECEALDIWTGYKWSAGLISDTRVTTISITFTRTFNVTWPASLTLLFSPSSSSSCSLLPGAKGSIYSHLYNKLANRRNKSLSPSQCCYCYCWWQLSSPSHINLPPSSQAQISLTPSSSSPLNCYEVHISLGREWNKSNKSKSS